MAERDELVTNLRQLMELERGFGVEWLPLPERAASAVAVAAVKATPNQRPIPTAITPTPRVVAPARIVTPSATAPATLNAWTPPGDVLTLPVETALNRIASDIAACQRCGLCSERQRTVPGSGATAPDILFIGDGPGIDEERQGLPAVGSAGQLLNKMIVAMGLQRDQVFITTVVKCRPPGNRAPEAAEINACHTFLMAQIAVLKPKVLCLLGNVPLMALFGATSPGITKMRGQRLEWQGLPTFPILDPSYLERNPAAKKPTWEDLKLVLKELGRVPPQRG